MKTQKFYNLTLTYQNFSYAFGSNLIQSVLQYIFDTDLKGRELAENIGNKNLYIIQVKENRTENKEWWQEHYAITKIEKL